jgi:hypothetical protein
MVALASVRELTLALVAAWAVYLVVALWLLRALSVDRGHRRDAALISAIAIVGRGVIVSLVAHFSTTGAGWSAASQLALMATLVAVSLVQARKMVLLGSPASESTSESTPAPRQGSSRGSRERTRVFGALEAQASVISSSTSGRPAMIARTCSTSIGAG